MLLSWAGKTTSFENHRHTAPYQISPVHADDYNSTEPKIVGEGTLHVKKSPGRPQGINKLLATRCGMGTTSPCQEPYRKE